MNRLARMERLERAVAQLRPDPLAVRAAFEAFRETGDLPEDTAVGRAVIQWAETGIDPTKYGDDFDSQAFRLRAYVESARSGDKRMNQLREEAVFADDPDRRIARIILQHFADAGHDPTWPLFQLGVVPTPEMTCGSVALSMIRWPFCVVDEVHHERLASVIAKFRHTRETVIPTSGKTADEWVHQLVDAATAFQESGQLPADRVMQDLVLADAELHVLLQTTDGVDDEQMRKALARCDQPDEGLRAEALALLQDLAEARVRRGAGLPEVE